MNSRVYSLKVERVYWWVNRGIKCNLKKKNLNLGYNMGVNCEGVMVRKGFI